LLFPSLPLVGTALLGGAVATVLVVESPKANAATTNCYDNSFGVSCSGSGGTTNCYNNSFGYSCSGSGGTTNCYNNSFGVSCSGSGGTTNCYDNSFGVSCSGSGTSFQPLPKPTPTPTRIYSYPTPTPTPTRIYSYPTPTPTSTRIYSYPTPTPTALNDYSTPYAKPSSTPQTSSTVCTSSEGLTTNCLTYPNFSIDYCSTAEGGTLQYLSGTKWVKLWNLKSTKDASYCSTTLNPHYVLISGTLSSRSNLKLRVIRKSVDNKSSSYDYFAVKIK